MNLPFIISRRRQARIPRMEAPDYPDLSIATTIHNNLERWMEMALSFEQEVGTVAEIVVVDDGSQTRPRVKGLRSPVRILRNREAQGFCAASDQALDEVRTPYALLLDADVTFMPGDFRHAFLSFKAVPILAWSNFLQMGTKGKRISPSEDVLPPAWIFALGMRVQSRWNEWRTRTTRPKYLNGRIKSVAIAHSSSALVRMTAFRGVDGFDRQFWQCESDNDLCLRLRRAGWKVGVDQVYTVRHDGIGGRAPGLKRNYDLYRSRLMLYEIHRPDSRGYLRRMLALRHFAEATLAFIIRPKPAHRKASYRFNLAKAALKGYPKLAD